MSKNFKNMNDEDLCYLLSAGGEKSRSAFEEIYSRYSTKLYTYCKKIGGSDENAQDIFQDTFIKAIATIQQGRYVESGKFLPWINRIAHNLIIDHFRREKNENTFSADAVDYDIVNNAKLSEKSVEDTLSNEQVLADVVHLIDMLPPSQQRVIRMRFFEDLSFKEIAERTDVSINTALGRMRYALLNMRRIAAEKNVYLEIK